MWQPHSTNKPPHSHSNVDSTWTLMIVSKCCRYLLFFKGWCTKWLSRGLEMHSFPLCMNEWDKLSTLLSLRRSHCHKCHHLLCTCISSSPLFAPSYSGFCIHFDCILILVWDIPIPSLSGTGRGFWLLLWYRLIRHANYQQDFPELNSRWMYTVHPFHKMLVIALG